MHEEPQRRLIKIADCDEVPWLQIRLRSVDPVNDKEKRLALARSMLRPRFANGRYDFDPTGSGYAFGKDQVNLIKATDLSVGQIQPIRVFRYPPGCEAISAKPYGVVCGYRRLQAARELNKLCLKEGKPAPLQELEAIIYILTKEEYDSKDCRFIFKAIAAAENCQRQEMHPADRINVIYELCETYYHLYPGARKPGPRNHQNPHRGADTYLASITGLSKSQIRSAVNIKKKLAVKIFSKWHRGTLGLGSVRALLPIPKHSQARIIDKLQKANKPITEHSIREEIAKDAKLRPLLSKRPLPEATAAALSPAPRAAPRNGASPPIGASTPEASLDPFSDHLIDCKDCTPCQYLSGDPTRCPVFAPMLVAIDVAARVCLNLTLHMEHSPATIAALEQRVTSLATAATALRQLLADSDAVPRFNLAALTPHNGKAA